MLEAEGARGGDEAFAVAGQEQDLEAREPQRGLLGRLVGGELEHLERELGLLFLEQQARGLDHHVGIGEVGGAARDAGKTRAHVAVADAAARGGVVARVVDAARIVAGEFAVAVPFQQGELGSFLGRGKHAVDVEAAGIGHRTAGFHEGKRVQLHVALLSVRLRGSTPARRAA
jgi:hypothetical protein